MKKLLLLLLALVMCVGILVACGEEKKPKEEITYKLDNAVAFVKNLYIGEVIKPEGSDVGIVTKFADFERVSSVPIAGVSYEVVWTVDETDTSKVKVIQGEGTTPTKIDVPDRPTEDIEFVLTATVKAGDGTSATLTFNVLIPKYDPISFEAYMEAKENDQVTVEGIVVAINSKSKGNSRNHLFLADASGKGGYYSYQMDQDPIADLGIEIGMTVCVSGPVAPYSGMQEIKGGTARIISSEKKEFAPVDITEMFKNGDSLKNYVGLPVTIKGVEIGGQELETATSQYLYFTLNGVESYLRTYVTDFPTTLQIVVGEDSITSSPDKTAIDTAHAEKFGWTANVTGILVLYNSNPYLIPMSTDCFEYLELVQKSNDEKIDLELDALTVVEKLGADKTVDVPTAGVNYSEVAITWTSNSEYAVVANDGKSIAFTIPATETTVTITATGKIGNTTDTRTFEVILTPKTLTFVANTPYYFGITDKNGTVKYLDGTTASNANYRWNLTDDISKAATFYVEVVEGGYYVYFYNGETKTYLNIVQNGKYTNLLAGDSGVSIWAYDAVLDTLAVDVDGTIYVPKNYNNYGNVEAKTSDYVNNDTYVTSFMAVEYYFGFADKNGTVKYLDGTNPSNANYRWNLTSDKALAATFYVEGNADGSYHIYFYKEGVKTYLNIVKNGNYTNLLAADTAVSKWIYNEEVKGYVVDVDGTLYVPKNYNNYGNVEAKTLDYTNNDTYVISLINANAAPEADNGENNDDADTTPSNPIPNGVEAVAVNTAYNMAGIFANGNLYFDGTIGNGRINGTTDKSAAATVKLEAGSAANEYYIYFEKDGTKTYLAAKESKSAGFDLITEKNDSAIWVIDATAKSITSKAIPERGLATQVASTYTNFSFYATSNFGTADYAVSWFVAA